MIRALKSRRFATAGSKKEPNIRPNTTLADKQAPVAPGQLASAWRAFGARFAACLPSGLRAAMDAAAPALDALHGEVSARLNWGLGAQTLLHGDFKARQSKT